MINAVHLTHLFTRSVNSVNLIENWIFVLFVLISCWARVLQKQFRSNLPSGGLRIRSFGCCARTTLWIVSTGYKIFHSMHRRWKWFYNEIELWNSITGIMNLYVFVYIKHACKYRTLRILLIFVQKTNIKNGFHWI